MRKSTEPQETVRIGPGLGFVSRAANQPVAGGLRSGSRRLENSREQLFSATGRINVRRGKRLRGCRGLRGLNLLHEP